MRKILESCPTCGGTLEIREIVCVNCATEVRSHYRPCDFCILTDEQSTFVRLFVLNRGNLSEMEKVLGVSYPTVRAKLEEIAGRLRTPVSATLATTPLTPASQPQVAVAMAQPANPGPNPAQPGAGASMARRQILDLVASGRLAAADALVHLRNLAGSSIGTPTASPTTPSTEKTPDGDVTQSADLDLEDEAEKTPEPGAANHTDIQQNDQQDNEYSAEQKDENIR